MSSWETRSRSRSRRSYCGRGEDGTQDRRHLTEARACAGLVVPSVFILTLAHVPLRLAISPQYVELLTAAHAYTTERQDELRSRHGLASMPHAHLNEATGQLIFSDVSQTPRVMASVQVVGSVNTEDRTWLWSWASPEADPSLCKDILEVRMLGEAREIEQLKTAFWQGDAVDGWEMTSITAYVLQAAGAYRAATPTGFTYFVMTSIESIPTGQAGESRET